MPRLNKFEIYLLRVADFFKRISDCLKLYLAKKHFPRYSRGNAYLSIHEYVGDNTMFKIVNERERVGAKNYE